MIPGDIKYKLYIDHVVLTVGNITQTKNFYTKILGEPDNEDEHSIMYYVGETKLFWVLPYGTLPKDDKFDANRIGLEHIAIGVQTLGDLKEIEMTLDKHAIKNSGIHIDRHSKKEKIWLDDPDGIRLEFYIKP